MKIIDYINHWDYFILSYINRPFNPIVNNLAILSIYLMYFVILIFFYLLYIERKHNTLKRYVGTSTLGFIIVYIIKYVVRRPRPHLFPLVEKIDPSFPSSHAFFSGLLLYIVFHERISVYFKLVLLIFSLTIPIIKMYIGVHYPSDVVVGFILGYISPSIFDYLQITLKKLSKNKNQKAYRNRK